MARTDDVLPIDLVREQLESALDHATDDTARYHIRTALQAIDAVTEPDD